MKNQYFGDARDYFKYEVLDRLASDLPGIEQLTCVWMLTPDDESNDGNVAFVADDDLPELTAFFRDRLESCDKGHCRVGEMDGYFGTRGYEFTPYGADEHFEHATRDTYFRAIDAPSLRHAVAFFDPDNGMEGEKTCSDKHLRYEELSQILGRMDMSSVAVVFQYQFRVRNWVQEVGRRLHERVSPHVAYVKEPSIALFVVARQASRIQQVVGILERVVSRQSDSNGPTREVGVIPAEERPLAS